MSQELLLQVRRTPPTQPRNGPSATGGPTAASPAQVGVSDLPIITVSVESGGEKELNPEPAACGVISFPSPGSHFPIPLLAATHFLNCIQIM